MIRNNHLYRKAKRLWREERGAVAPLVGFCIIMLVGAVGVAVDIGRAQVAQSKLQAALDSAGLAAGSMVSQNLDDETLKPEAWKYLNANFLGKTVDATLPEADFHLHLSDDQSLVILDATASLPTTFMRIFGKESIEVAARTEITRETTGLEVAVVVDLTGSMCSPCQKLTDLKSAATDLVNTLFGSNNTVDDLWVGFVPFTATVNVGTSHTNWSSDYASRAAMDNCVGATSGTPKCTTATTLSPTISLDSPTKPKVSTRSSPITLVDDWMVGSPAGWYFKPHAWGGCFEERYSTNRDVTDDPPSVEKFKTYFWPDMSANVIPNQDTTNNWLDNSNGNRLISNSTTGQDTSANKGCPRQAVTPMTNSKSTLLSAISAFQSVTNQHTHVNVGAVWGWRMLSPKWRGLWGGTMDANNLPLDYDEPLSQKAVIIMTDGMNTMTDYSAFGLVTNGVLGSTNPGSGTITTKLDNKLKTVCNAMKSQGIIVYTVLFQEDTASAKAVMKACASEEDFFFDTQTGADLKTAFRAIGDSLSKLRISK
jgi:hypothetical protein